MVYTFSCIYCNLVSVSFTSYLGILGRSERNAYHHCFHKAMQQRYRFHKLLLQSAIYMYMRAVGAVCENSNAVASLREKQRRYDPLTT